MKWDNMPSVTAWVQAIGFPNEIPVGYCISRLTAHSEIVLKLRRLADFNEGLPSGELSTKLKSKLNYLARSVYSWPIPDKVQL